MKSLLTVVIVTCLASGCNSEQSAQYKTANEATPDTKPQIDTPVLVPEPQPPIVEVPSTPLEPSMPVAPPTIEPPKPTLPIFIGEGINTITLSNHTAAQCRAVVTLICATTKKLSILIILSCQSGR